PAVLDREVLAFDIARFAEAVAKRGNIRCIRRAGTEKTDHRHRFLLRTTDKRHRKRRAADNGEKVAPPHSMTSSARCSSDCGTVRPSALAVFRLITSSNLVGCSTGRSAGLAPFRIFPA